MPSGLERLRTGERVLAAAEAIESGRVAPSTMAIVDAADTLLGGRAIERYDRAERRAADAFSSALALGTIGLFSLFMMGIDTLSTEGPIISPLVLAIVAFVTFAGAAVSAAVGRRWLKTRLTPAFDELLQLMPPPGTGAYGWTVDDVADLSVELWYVEMPPARPGPESLAEAGLVRREEFERAEDMEEYLEALAEILPPPQPADRGPLKRSDEEGSLPSADVREIADRHRPRYGTRALEPA